jgi:phospholipase C
MQNTRTRATLIVATAVLSCFSLFAEGQVSSSHLVVVLEANHPYSAVIGSSSMPYLNGLAAKGGVATRYYANMHPELVNYLELTTGQTVTTYDGYSGVISADNIVREIANAGRTWKAYAESLPSTGYTGVDQYPYVRHHNPFVYLSDVTSNSTQAANVVNFRQLATDLANNALPNYSFIIPNEWDDAHDCPNGGSGCTEAQKLLQADNWLKNNVGPVLSSPIFQPGGDGVLIVVFDNSYPNDVAFGGGNVAMVIYGPNVKPGYMSTAFYQHQSVLNLACTALQLAACPGQGANAPSMAEFFKQTPPSPVSLAKGSLWFGNGSLGVTSGTYGMTLTNSQSVPLHFSSITAAGDFAQTNSCGAYIVAGGSCYIRVTFTPTALGNRVGAITISDDAPNSPQVLTVGGYGISPLTASPSSLAFGNQNLNTMSVVKQVQLTNNAATAFTINSISASGDFDIQSNSCGASLAAGASCTIGVAYTPSQAGDQTGSLTISDNAVTSPQIVNLTGTGADNVILWPASVTFGDQAVGNTSAARTVQLRNNQSVSLTITGITASAGFAENDNCGSSLPPNGTCSVNVTFTPTMTGVTSGTLTINDTANTVNPQVVNLSGNGVGSCVPSTVNQTLTLCEPFANSMVNSPVHIVAQTTDTNPVTMISVYVDNIFKYRVNASSLDTFLPLTPGQHRLGVIATDTTGVNFKQVVYVNVAASWLSKIKHIIFLVQENRPYDQYFGMMGQYRANKGYSGGFDSLPLNAKQLDKAGQYIYPFHLTTVCTESADPSWNASHIDYDGGKMDKFLQTATASSIDPQGTRIMGYYNWNDLPYYYELAFQFGTSDRWFSPVMAATPLNRMYLFSGTSAGHINRSDVPPPGGWPFPTIWGLLRSNGISFRYYWEDFNLIRWKQWVGYSDAYVASLSQYYTDIQNEATLPSVLFIEAGSNLDEHPGRNLTPGVNTAAQIINALMQSPSWYDSVFVLTFDEFGGFYDHVLPANVVAPDNIPPMLQPGDQPGTFTKTGLRVPFLIVSPWIRPHIVSHSVRDFTAILKLIESRFGLPSLTARDASMDDMSEFLDFTAPAQLVPPPLPSQPSGSCNFKAEVGP